jgi:broad specificity phosphatase PhoE
MRLLITRHGETIENNKGFLQGHSEGTLNFLGIRQAQNLALRLSEEEIDIVYCSDLKRAVDTANEILKYHREVELVYTASLRERDFGEFQGRRRIEIGWDMNKPDSEFPDPLHGESIRDVYNRAEDFIRMIRKKHFDKTVLLVGHGFIGYVVCCVLKGISRENIQPKYYLNNTSLTEFQIENKGSKPVEVLYNCSFHNH